MITAISIESARNYFKSERVDLLTQVFKKTIIETSVAVIIFAITFPFIASGAGVTLLAASIGAMLLFNTVVRISIAELIYRNSIDASERKKTLIKCLSFLAPLSFSTITSNSSDILIHEAGHAAAAKLFFSNAKPSIFIDPFKGGFTKYSISGLTELGKKIGFRNADIAVTLAGAVLSLGVSALTLVGAYELQESSPELSNYLFFSSIFNISFHAYHALSALWTPLTNTSHDFVYLSLYGISPILSAASIIAIPIVIKIAFVGGYYLKEMAFQPANAVAA